MIAKVVKMITEVKTTIEYERWRSLNLSDDGFHVICGDAERPELSLTERELLKRGLKFIPFHGSGNISEELSGVKEDFLGRLYVNYRYSVDVSSGNRQKRDHPFQMAVEFAIAKETETQDCNALSRKEHGPEFETLIGRVGDMLDEVPQLFYHLTKSEKIHKEATQKLSQKSDWTIKPADKNMGLCLIHNSVYQQMLSSITEDVEVYETLTPDQTRDLLHGCVQEGRAIQRAFANLDYSRELLESINMKLFSRAHRFLEDFAKEPSASLHDYTCSLYAMPKIHKPTSGHVPKVRPIVQGFASIQTTANRFLARLLFPVLALSHTVILETRHALSGVQRCRFPGSGQLKAFSADVEALYPNVPLDLVRTSWRSFAIYCREKSVTLDDQARQLVDWLLEDQIVSWIEELLVWCARPVIVKVVTEEGVQFYRQKKGLPMGFPISPLLANMILFTECEIPMAATIRSKTVLFGRYIDDLIILSDIKEESAIRELLQTIYSNRIPSLKLTVESGERITFLDFQITVEAEAGKCRTVNYWKQVGKFQYVDTSSRHPPATCRAIVRGETIRMARLNSRMADLAIALSDLGTKLYRRGYRFTLVSEEMRSALQSVFQKGNQAFINYSISEPTIEPHSPWTLLAGTASNSAFLKQKLTRELGGALVPLRLKFNPLLKELSLAKKMNEIIEQWQQELPADHEFKGKPAKCITAWSTSDNLLRHLVKADGHSNTKERVRVERDAPDVIDLEDQIDVGALLESNRRVRTRTADTEENMASGLVIDGSVTE